MAQAIPVKTRETPDTELAKTYHVSVDWLLELSDEIEIVDIINEKFKNENVVQIYDLKLYSETVQDFIKILSNGKFQVSIPVKDSLKGKTLFAYYFSIYLFIS